MEDWKTFKKELFKNREVKKEYERLKPEYALIAAIINVRIKKGITQEQLARKLGTKQSAIARLESGRSNPSIEFLGKLAQALNSNLQIKFTPL
ncbi:MAG: helix-turn-helix domain-containing protein [Patescibacteria group bacterium]|nr:helix-turn-helix domain-containing protein [Patescibacteria group bacterium]